MSERRDANRTILYTDIVGSTRLFSRLGETFRRMLARHDEIFKEAARSADPDCFLKGSGDGFYAAFENPSHAFEAATLFRAGLESENWGDFLPDDAKGPEFHLRSRVGLHTGEVTLIDDAQGNVADLDGPVRNVAERVMGLAAGNQIVASQAARDAVRASGGDGRLRWERFGDYKLRDVEELVHIWGVGDQWHPPGTEPERLKERRPSSLS